LNCRNPRALLWNWSRPGRPQGIGKMLERAPSEGPEGPKRSERNPCKGPGSFKKLERGWKENPARAENPQGVGKMLERAPGKARKAEMLDRCWKGHPSRAPRCWKEHPASAQKAPSGWKEIGKSTWQRP